MEKFEVFLLCGPWQPAAGGDGQEGRAGADPPAAAEGAVSDGGREAGAGGRAASQGERPAGSHAAAGEAGEGTAGSTEAV